MGRGEEGDDFDDAPKFAEASPCNRLADAVFASPVNDYRARLKECLVILGVLPAAHLRAPLRAIGDAERARLRRVIETAIGVSA